MSVAESGSALKQRALREIALFVGLLFFGLVLMPIAVYFVGQQFFGDYGGRGYNHFFGTLSGKVREWDVVAWFLILAPYLAWQILRLTAHGWRVAGRSAREDQP